VGSENGKTITLMQSKIQKIGGDASFRKFYRITYNKKSKIIIFAKKEKYQNLIAYSAINNFLKRNKILAPKLFNQNYSKGIMIIEDFGNLTFYKFLLKKKNRFKSYKKLIDLLIKIQKIKPEKKIKNTVVGFHTLKEYTNQTLHKESDLFFDWYLPMFLNKKNSLGIKKKTKKILNEIYKKLNFPNSYFVHRDYHVQNLMKVGKRIGIIDSQDALIGNPAYDLASLIDDVRIRNSNKLKKQIYNYYLKKNHNMYRFQSKEFLEDFNILSVQRCLKIIGIFSRLYKRDKKKIYLKLIPYTWTLLELRMRNKIFSDLRKVLNINIKKRTRKMSIFK